MASGDIPDLALIAEIMAEAARNDRIRTIAHTINRSVSAALMRVRPTPRMPA